MIEKVITYSIFLKSIEQNEILSDLLSGFKILKLCSNFQNRTEVLEDFVKSRPSILFMDVDEIDVLSAIYKPMFIVGICNKKQSKSLKKYLDGGFFDFLVMPIQKKDFMPVIAKILNFYGEVISSQKPFYSEAAENPITYNNRILEKASFTKDYIFLEGNRKREALRICFDDVKYIALNHAESVFFFENGNRKTVKTTLKYLQDKLPSDKFQKINRSIIVNIDKISKYMKNDKILIGDEVMVVSRNFKRELKQKLKM